ncbi:3-ketoacyl-CoA synthase [Entamoeba marina]
MSKDLWYPKSIGDDNQIVHKIKDTLVRKSQLKKLFEALPRFCYSCIGLGYVYFLFTLFKTRPILSPENIVGIFLSAVTITTTVAYSIYKYATTKHVYLLTATTSELPEEYEVSHTGFLGPLREKMQPESAEFVERLVEKTGLGTHTCLPKIFHADTAQNNTMKLCREEVMDVMKLACDEAFESTGIKPQEVDCVITSCTFFNPTPSISAMLMNHYKMKQTCKNYHLGGQGCAASVIAVDLAKDYLAAHSNSVVLIFSTENITSSMYTGEDKSRLLYYTLFRSGGGAVILSNKSKHKKIARYELETTVSVHNAIDDNSHKVIYFSEDEKQKVGVFIGKTLINYISALLIENTKLLFPQYLRGFEWLRYILGFPKIVKETNTVDLNIRENFQAFCIHQGGRGVIDKIQTKFNLTDEDCFPSRSSLCRFGNTSSASVWYAFRFIERCDFLQKGDRMLQLAFGSGVKCTSAVWRKL